LNDTADERPFYETRTQQIAPAAAAAPVSGDLWPVTIAGAAALGVGVLIQLMLGLPKDLPTNPGEGFGFVIGYLGLASILVSPVIGGLATLVLVFSPARRSGRRRAFADFLASAGATAVGGIIVAMILGFSVTSDLAAYEKANILIRKHVETLGSQVGVFGREIAVVASDMNSINPNSMREDRGYKKALDDVEEMQSIVERHKALYLKEKAITRVRIVEIIKSVNNERSRADFLAKFDNLEQHKEQDKFWSLQADYTESTRRLLVLFRNSRSEFRQGQLLFSNNRELEQFRLARNDHNAIIQRINDLVAQSRQKSSLP
jgi:hypothetical protein